MPPRPPPLPPDATLPEVPPPPGLGSYRAPPLVSDLTFRTEQYAAREKSGVVTFLLEFLLFPGVGCLYVGAFLEAGIEWGVMVIGATLAIIAGGAISLVVAGALLVVTGRLFGIVGAMLGVQRFNAELREQLHLEVALAPALRGDSGAVALALRF